MPNCKNKIWLFSLIANIGVTPNRKTKIQIFSLSGDIGITPNYENKIWLFSLIADVGVMLNRENKNMVILSDCRRRAYAEPPKQNMVTFSNYEHRRTSNHENKILSLIADIGATSNRKNKI